MFTLLMIAVRNLRRNRLRSILTIVAAAVAILAFVLLRTVLAAWHVASEYAAKDRLATRHKVSFVMTLPRHYVDVIRTIPGVRQATFMNWFAAKLPNKPDEFLAAFATDPSSFVEVMDEVSIDADSKRRWLEDRKGAIIGDIIARKLGVKVGDRITLTGTLYPGDWEFTIAGIYSPTRKSVDRSSFWFHWTYLNESLPPSRRDQVGWITSRIDVPNRGADISSAIDRVFEEKEMATTTMSERALNLSFLGMFAAVLTALDLVSLIILIIMAMILSNTIAMGVRERTREYGVLRALGFSPAQVCLFVVGEAAGLGVAAAALGLAISYPIVEVGLGRFLEENLGAWFPYFRVQPATAALAIALAIGLALVASIPPAIRAGRLSVTDALRRVA